MFLLLACFILTSEIRDKDRRQILLLYAFRDILNEIINPNVLIPNIICEVGGVESSYP